VISVVIPTRNRPNLVCRAVRSALSQTFRTIEVIVVVDGPDEATARALHALDDSRLRIDTLSRSQGVSAALNAGVDAARGRWIAFLDDDDEWLLSKLDIQLHTAQQSTFQDPIISCRLIKRSEATDTVLPWRLPAPGEPMSDYLFRRTGLVGGEGLVQTSTILTTKALLKEVPFRAELRKHVDIDWLLRASMRKGTNVQFVAPTEPLVIWYREQQRETSSNRKDWRYSLSWIQQNRHLVTPGAYGSFLLTWLSANAVQQKDRSAFWPLLSDAFRHGAPSAIDVCVFAGIWVMPRGPRERLSNIVARR